MNTTKTMMFIIGLIAGAAVGSFTTYTLTKKKYETILDEEIAAIKEVFAKKTAKMCHGTDSSEEPLNEWVEAQAQTSAFVSAQEKALFAKEKPPIHDYTQHFRNNANGVVLEAQVKPTEILLEPTVIPDPDIDGVEPPRVITPDEVGDYTEWEIIELTYYSDGMLADSNDDLVSDIETKIGSDALLHFGEYEDDAVHVANERFQCYYEILADNRKYADVIAAKRRRPHQAGG